MRLRFPLRVVLTAVIPLSLSGQGVDRTLSSMAGGAAGGLAGIVLSLPSGCGSLFRDRVCQLPAMVKGFAVGNVIGSTIGALHGGAASSCSKTERFGRALAGSLAGAGLGTAAVATTHGFVRIGLSPMVQLAEGIGAAAMLNPCDPTRTGAPDSAALNFEQQCRAPGRALARDAAGVGLAGGYAGLYIYFKHAWWSGERAPQWYVENDWDQNERDLDKFGHFFGGYQLTRLTAELLRAGCMPPTRAALLAALYAYSFQFQIEEWDGTQKMYGFSPADLVADAGGAIFAIAQQRTTWLQATKPVWSYRPTLAYRRRNEPGRVGIGQPRATTDYSGQTYWFSTDVNALLPESAKRFWPAILRVSAGYSITDYVNPDTGAPQRARRKILLSIDIDPEHLPGDGKAWRTIKHELSFFRIPGPTLQLTPSSKFFAAYY
jgi:Predicted periplasmic lipoprotein (DUF2279)